MNVLSFKRKDNVERPVIVKLRNKVLKTFKWNGSFVITQCKIAGNTIYLSFDEPVAIKYADPFKQSIMTFKKLGKYTLLNRLKLRKEQNYKTVLEETFNGELYSILSKLNKEY